MYCGPNIYWHSYPSFFDPTLLDVHYCSRRTIHTVINIIILCSYHSYVFSFIPIQSCPRHKKTKVCWSSGAICECILWKRLLLWIMNNASSGLSWDRSCLIFKIFQNHATPIPTYSTSSTSLGWGSYSWIIPAVLKYYFGQVGLYWISAHLCWEHPALASTYALSHHCDHD